MALGDLRCRELRTILSHCERQADVQRACFEIHVPSEALAVRPAAKPAMDIVVPGAYLEAS